MKQLLISLALLPLLARADSVPEHLTNKAFDAKKLPIADEPMVSADPAKKAWATKAAAFQKKCEATTTWEAKPKGKLAVTSFKNQTVPVTGGFDHYLVSLVTSETEASGRGIIDTASWASNDVARDRRVQRYILGAESEASAVIPFTFTLKQWNPKPNATWQTEAEATVSFRGKDIKVSMPVKVSRQGNVMRLTSTKPARFTYASTELIGSVQKLIERCNHQSLASFVDMQVELVLDNVCAKL